MRIQNFNHIILVLLALLGLHTSLKCQIVQGTVYDISQRIPIQGVSVLTSSGYGTQTDSNGFYSVKVVPNDSLWFSYLGKPTPKYPVKTILNPAAFDISVQIPAVELPGVTIRKPSYRADSLQNRQEYGKYFNYRKPGIRLSSGPVGEGGAGVGLDLDELINVFRFRRNRNLAFIQRWLLYQEQDKYVDHRFSKLFVHKLTGLETPELDTFMYRYRPSFEVVSIMSDADLGLYILNCYKDYRDRMNPYFRKPSISGPKP